MIKSIQNPRLFLQLFAEGAVGNTGVNASDAGVQGVKPSADSIAQESQTPDRNAEFLQLISGPFKDLYDARVQDIVQKRVKNHQKTLEQYKSMEPVLNRLAESLGVPPGDGEALCRAMEARQAAQSPKQRRANAMAQYDGWIQQSEEAKQLFPGLELRQEVQNPRFLQLLDQGLHVQDAYLITHRDQILPAAMQYSAKAMEQKLANRIAANGVRPPETGMTTKGSPVTQADISHMSRAQRADIIRRVQQGEVIRL